MSRWFRIPAALRRSDAEDATVTQSHPQPASPTNSHGSSDSFDNLNHLNHGRSSESDESVPTGSDMGLEPSPSKNGKDTGKRSLFKRSSKNYHHEKEGGGSLSIAKRVKSSLHLNNTVNASNMSLTSPTAGDFGTQPFNSVKSIFSSKERRPSAMQMQAAMRRTGSNDALNRDSAEDARATSPTPTLQANQPMTPLDRNRQFGSVRSILREANTPGSGQNVRFFGRDAYKVISPNSTASTPDASANPSGVDDDTRYAQQMHEAAMEHGAMTPGSNPDETRFHSTNTSPNGFLSLDGNGNETQYYSENASPHVFSSPNVGDATNYQSANAYTPSNGHTTQYESAHGSSNGFSGATTFHSPAAFAEGMPDAQSTPYVTTQQSQAHVLGLPTPPPQLAGVFVPPEDNRRASNGSNEFEHLSRAPGARPTINTQAVIAGGQNRVSSHSTASSMSIDTPHSVFNGSERNIRRFSDQVHLHSAGEENGEKSIPERAASSLGFQKVFSKRESVSAVEGRMDFPDRAGSVNASRMRSLSDRVFSRPAVDSKRESKSSTSPSISEDPFTESPNSAQEPDPFRADASNYYNSAAGFPNTPPRLGHIRADSGVSGVTAPPSMRSFSGSGSVHSAGGRDQTSRTGSMASTSTSQSRQTLQDTDDMINALRTQLAFHQELATQYERDLRSRDAQAALMNQKVAAYESEAEKRSKAMRGMRKKVQEMERVARMLEDAAERSAADNFEKSLFDPHGDAVVKSLQAQILEHERGRVEMERREREMRDEIESLGEELRRRDEELQKLLERIEQLEKIDHDFDSRLMEAKESYERREEEASFRIDQHHEVEVAWAEEQARMVRETEAFRKQLEAKESELTVLKLEVEAQWGNTEKLNAGKEEAVTRKVEAEKKCEEAEKARDELKARLQDLEKRVEEMEMEWTESENRRANVEGELEETRRTKVAAEKEIEELRRELQRVSSQNPGSSTSSVSDGELEQLRRERQSALDDAETLQQLLLQRETVNVESSRKLSQKDVEISRLREEVNAIRREHSRYQAEHARALSEADVRASTANDQLGESTKQGLASIADARALREQVKRMEEENEKLRKDVRVLKSSSADQDVKLVQLEKQHDKDVDDKLGLNIALDSKQQELELLKRHLGVKGTAGATVGSTASRVGRRDSIVSISSFKTPMPSRPPSALSDVDKSGKSSAASTGGKVPLGRSTRVNTMASVPLTGTVKKVSPRSSLSSVTVPPARARSNPTAPTASSAAKSPSTSAAKTTMTTKRISSPPAALAGRRKSLGALNGLNSSDNESVLTSDKENETPKASARTTGTANKRMPMQPLAVPA